MPLREGPVQSAPPPNEPHDESRAYPAEKARGGEIILRTRTRRIIFLSGLVGAVALVLILLLLRVAGA